MSELATVPPPFDRAPRRADAERSIARILDAAVDALAGDPAVSMSEIAGRAGVARATVYVHFPTREALVAAVTRRAVIDVTQAIETSEPRRGAPAEALRRVMAAAWRALERYHALVAVNAGLPDADLHDRHRALQAAIAPLIARGQRDGAFRADVPVVWHLSTIVALVHAASAELQAGRIADEDVEPALLATVLAALGHQSSKEH